MSRKNRNASRRNYNREQCMRERMSFAQNGVKRETALTKENDAASRKTMVNERVGYEYQFLSSAVLETDLSYQRRMNSAQVERIVAEFNPLLVNAVKVSHRDGRFYVFDGAHTLAALRRIHGEQPFMVECKVFSGMTYQEEAGLFALQTGTSRPVGFDYKLRARLAAETPKEAEFLSATEMAGMRLSDAGQSSARNVIAAKATAMRIFEKYGATLYTEMLRLIADTWYGEEWSLSKPVLSGCAVFLSVYGDQYNRERFIRKLGYTNADELAAIARRQNVKDQPHQYALALLGLYNKGGRGVLDGGRLLA